MAKKWVSPIPHPLFPILQQYRAQWATEHEAIEQQLAALRAAAQQRQRTAEAQVQVLAWIAYLQELDPYRAQGLEVITWDGSTVLMQGKLGPSAIQRLQAITQSRGETLQLSAGCWEVEQSMTAPQPADAPKHEPIDIADWLGRAEPMLRTIDSELGLQTASEGSGYTRYKLTLQAPRGELPVFSVLAGLLERVPGQLDSIKIHYERTLPQTAILKLTIWGI